MQPLIFPMISDHDRKLPFYIKSIGVHWQQEYVSRPSGHPEFHYLHCSSGEGVLNINHQQYTIGPAMGFFFEPGIPHEYYALKEPWETNWVTFEGYAVQDFCRTLFPDRWNTFGLSNPATLERALESIYKAAVSPDYYSNHIMSAMLYEFLIRLKSNMTDGVFFSRPLVKNQLQNALRYIESNYKDPVTLEEMAAEAGISPQHLCRLFKQSYNMRPFEYLTRYRLKEAKSLLLSPENHPVKVIASLVGINDTSYFCAIFRKYEHCSPIEFRNMFSK